MTPEELKASIIQLALQGKLVPQIKEEGTGEELYKQICIEKAKLIIEGKIKKEKEPPEISEDEIPFEIPETWKWANFGTVVDYSMGKTPPRAEPQWWGTDISWISIADMPENGHILSSKEKVSNLAMAEKFNNRISNPGTLLMSFKLTVGRVSILDIPAVHNEAIISIFPILDVGNVFRDYLFYALPFISTFGDSKDAIKGKTLNSSSIVRLPIPLPPLDEQKRIVAKIEELLPLVDKYEEAWNKLEALNKKFPVDMEKSILQYAMEGKLVPQIKEEGTGEELYKQICIEKAKLIKEGKIKKGKDLPEISEDEIPFEIPETWKWIHIGEVFTHSAGKALNSSNREGCEYEYITTSNVYWNYFDLHNLRKMYYTADELDKCTAKKGDLLVLEGGDIGRAAIWDYEYDIRIQNHIHRLRNVFGLDIKFYYYAFFLYKESGLINGKGIGIQGLSANALHKLVMPLPPLEEQKRIVAKIEELIPLCRKLSNE